jgi:hypothetical protein
VQQLPNDGQVNLERTVRVDGQAPTQLPNGLDLTHLTACNASGAHIHSNASGWAAAMGN